MHPAALMRISGNSLIYDLSLSAVIRKIGIPCFRIGSGVPECVKQKGRSRVNPLRFCEQGLPLLRPLVPPGFYPVPTPVVSVGRFEVAPAPGEMVETPISHSGSQLLVRFSAAPAPGAPGFLSRAHSGSQL